MVGPQRQEGVAIAAGCRRISAKAPHAIMVTSEAREQGQGPLGQVLDRHQLSFHKARDRQGNLIQVGPVVPVAFVSGNLNQKDRWKSAAVCALPWCSRRACIVVSVRSLEGLARASA